MWLTQSERDKAIETGRERAAPQAPLPRLVSRTLNDREPESSEPRYRCTLWDFGDGLIECTGVWMDAPARRTRAPRVENVSRDLTRENRSHLETERAERSIRRAKQSMRRRVYALSPDRMLTLTKRGKFETLDDCWAAWARFERICSRFYGERWKYVVVPELHADGCTYHMHVAIQGFYNVGLLRRFWFKALGGSGHERGADTPGNVDISWKPHSGRRGTRMRIAGYLRKYMGKNLAARVRGRRAFAASRGLHPHRVERWSEPLHLGRSTVVVVAERLRPLAGSLGVQLHEWREAGLSGFTIKTRY